MLERRVEGFILVRPGVPFLGDHLELVEQAGVPFVLVGTSVVPASMSSKATTTRAATKPRGIFSSSGTDRSQRFSDDGLATRNRALRGCQEALRDFGLSSDNLLEERAEDWGIEAGEAAAARLLARGSKFTALFAHSDLIALGAIARLRAAGLHVPDQVSVVGFDDLPVAAVVDPPLTTVHQATEEKGAFALGSSLRT